MSRPIDPRLPRAVPAVRRLLVALANLQIIGALLAVAQAGALAQLIVAIVQRGWHGTELGWLAGLLAAAATGRAAVAAGQEWLTARASSRARASLRDAALTAVTGLGPAWVARQPAGRLVTAAGPGLEALDGYLTRAVPALVAATVVPGIVLTRIAIADWQSALVLVVTLPLVPLFMVLVGVTTRRRMDAQYAALARLAGHFLDLVQGLTTLKVYGQSRRQVETVRRGTQAYRRQTMETLRVAFLSGLVLDLLATLSVAVVAVDVGLRLAGGRLSLETALLVLLLAPELFAPLRAVGAQYHAAEEGRVAAGAALDILDEAAACQSRGGTGDVVAAGSVCIRGLDVLYPDRSGPALAGIDLTVAPGEVLAIQGESGGGKSTLLGVLLCFIEPSDGSVVVGTVAGDADLALLDPVAWRVSTAWAPQRPHPTQSTVASEVALGDRSASLAQIDQAIQDCQAPHPDTVLGEDGARLSAGQRRRVALARAVLRARAVRAAGGVPVVLLDEPSEDLDADTEQVVAAAITDLTGWATVLMVTHSPRLARLADRRVELKAGRIVSDLRQERDTSISPPRAPVLAAAPATPSPAKEQVSLATLLVGWGDAGRQVLVAALLSGATGLAGLALTSTSVWLIVRAAEHPNVQALAIAVVGVRTFALAKALLRYAERLVAHDGALRLLADVRARVFAALEPLAPAGLADFRRGDLLRRFVSDVDGAQEGLVRAVVPLAGAVITAAGAVILATLLAPVAGAILAAALLIGLAVVPALARRLAGDATNRADAAGRRDALTFALLDGLAELVAYGADGAAVTAVAHADALVMQAARRPALAAAAGAGLTGVGAAVSLPLVLLASASATAAGALSPVAVGVLAACVLAGFDALAPLPAAFAAWSGLLAGLRRVAALLATPAPIAEPARPAAVPVGPLGLCLDGVAVAPAVGAGVVLADATLVLRPGERVAVMGPSGCGKSTLLTAAMRLLPVQAGSLDLVAGGQLTSLADLDPTDVPPLIAGSLQGDHVFNASLRDNLRVVRPTSSDHELDAVAARVGLAEFVDGLPHGWSSPAGPDGGSLSGGQRQRLLLARALLADPAVLVLDEPTAHLDVATERAVLRDLLAGTRGHTVLLSTHRNLLDDELDRVIRIDHGTLLTDQLPAAVPG